jgi:nucleotide-binding universal stress UspA family protein
MLAIAAILIVNSHLEAFYPVSFLAGDGLLTEAAELSASVEHLPEAIRKELQRFADKTFEGAVTPDTVRLDVTTGKPAVEILRVAHELPAALIVMSTHGLTGVRKLFFGSTTERVLRETTVPVLLTPAHDHGPARTEDVKRAMIRAVDQPRDHRPRDAAKEVAAAPMCRCSWFTWSNLRLPPGLPHLPNLRRAAVRAENRHELPRIPPNLRRKRSPTAIRRKKFEGRRSRRRAHRDGPHACPCSAPA